MTTKTHKAAEAVNRKRLRSVGKKSMTSIVTKLETFAIQKKNPLTISDFIPYFYISIKANETNELKPALSTMMMKIRK